MRLVAASAGGARYTSGTHDRRLYPSDASLTSASQPPQIPGIPTLSRCPTNSSDTVRRAGTPSGRTRRTVRRNRGSATSRRNYRLKETGRGLQDPSRQPQLTDLPLRPSESGRLRGRDAGASLEPGPDGSCQGDTDVVEYFQDADLTGLLAAGGQSCAATSAWGHGERSGLPPPRPGVALAHAILCGLLWPSKSALYDRHCCCQEWGRVNRLEIAARYSSRQISAQQTATATKLDSAEFGSDRRGLKPQNLAVAKFTLPELQIFLYYPSLGAGERRLMQRVPIFRLSSVGEVLPTGDVHQIRRVLRAGGLCLLPSDTAYALAVQPLVRGSTALLDAVLARKGAKISLSFASQVMVERFVDLGFEERRLLDSAGRTKPITVVAPLAPTLDQQVRDALPAALFTRDALAVRLPHSWIERQVSAEIDGPITSAAIYYENGSPVRNFDDALGIVKAGIESLDLPLSNLTAIRHPTIRSIDLSSVVEFRSRSDGRREMNVLREGAVSAKDLAALAGTPTPRDYDEWT